MSSHITFLAPKGTIEHTEVMRITRDGVFVNPDVAVDEAAKTVLDALDDQIKILVQKAVEEEREACAQVCKNIRDTTSNEAKGKTVASHCAIAIRERGAP